MSEPIGRREPYAATALFDTAEAAEGALVSLVRAGVPRDLIDVVVSPQAAQRFYRGLARQPGRAALRYAGIGGLVGLVIGAAISFIIIALPGFQAPGVVAFVQLLGPNLATVLGALIGAAYGLTRGRPAERRHRRAAEAPDAIVMAVATRSREEAEQLARLLADSSGRDARVE
jgi:hypothetical protein